MIDRLIQGLCTGALALSTTVAAPSSPAADPCPPGAHPTGAGPPQGRAWSCVLTVDGQPLRHGWHVEYGPRDLPLRACEYARGELHGRCSTWTEQGQLLARGSYDHGVRVGHWWFWEQLEKLDDEDGAVARASAEGVLDALDAGVGPQTPALAQFVLEQGFEVHADIRVAPKLCAATSCVRAATVDGRRVLAVNFDPSSREVAASEVELARAAEAAAAGHEQIETARRQRARDAARAASRQRAAQLRWQRSSLRCVDGTLSPSCVCGGPRRGCCSHHGGVAGCSRAYPELEIGEPGPLIANEFVRPDP